MWGYCDENSNWTANDVLRDSSDFGLDGVFADDGNIMRIMVRLILVHLIVFIGGCKNNENIKSDNASHDAYIGDTQDNDGDVGGFKKVSDATINNNSISDIDVADNDVIEYGRIASQNHWGEDRKIDLDGLLKVRRKEDDGNELWKVFNRVQENMLKGGIITSKKVKDRIIVNKTRPIKSVDTNVSLNKMLWGLTEEWL